jgi:hypothetical protein
VAGHLAHGDRVADDQPDQATPGLSLGLRIKVQRGVEVELPEQNQLGTACACRTSELNSS